MLSKNFKVSGHICCISRPFIVRAVHCYALCNMLWFAHRVGNCFIVSIYFIAIAPSQTIAIITLLLCTILIIILALASIMHICCSTDTTTTSSEKCLNICNSLTILCIVLSFIATLFCFTIIFVDLTQHGLSSSTIGSTLLSISIPSLLFVLGVLILTEMLIKIAKQQVKLSTLKKPSIPTTSK